ncbi:MAG TPA: efflux RND transporter permease subunit, partial [Cytophagaceae bacterium]|nr:efflux RND transporter permease subunit [Cytophagaceae bacterium]
MISKIIDFSLSKRWIILGGVLLICVNGLWCYTLLKIEAYPDISDTNVVVITKYNGRAAEEVEQQVTIPIERALNSVPHVLSRRSRTIFGLSVVQLSFEDGVDDFYARQVVNEKLSVAEIPAGVSSELAPMTTPVGEVFRYVVEASDEQYTPMDIRTLHDWTIKPYLLQTQGVADISPFGGPIKQFHVLTSPERLKRYDLTLKDIIAAVEDNNLNTGGNIIQRGGQGFAVRGIGAIRNPEDIEKIVITSINGVPIFIKDVAEVEIAPPGPSGILGYTIPDENIDNSSAVEGIILLRRGENASEVLNGLKKKIVELSENELPDGVSIRVLYDRSNLVDYTIDTVSHTLIEGITIVTILLVLFLGNFRSALVVAMTIPVSLFFSFILLELSGIPANLLSLGAIDFGIIVDGACVMAAAIIRRIKEASDEDREKGIIYVVKNGAQEIGKEIFFTVLIIILAYLPLFTLQRVEGKLFSPMAYTLSFAVIGSLLCALTLIPVLISFVFSDYYKKNPKKETLAKKGFFSKIRPFHFIETLYSKNLTFNLKNPILTVAIGFLFLSISSVLILPKIGTEFLPELDEGSIFARCFLPSGVSIQENARYAPAIRRIIAKHPQVKNIITQTGRNDDGTDPFASNRTELMVELKDYS